MSVIGRLDEQVDKVLISPLAEKNERATNAPENNSAIEIERAQTEAKRLKRNEVRSEKLPVWLL